MDPLKCTVGTPVTYWPIRKEDGSFHGDPFHTTIRYQAYQTYGRFVCFIEGKSGWIECSHLVERTDTQSTPSTQTQTPQ